MPKNRENCTTQQLRASAISYAEAGHYVLPLSRRSKRPAIPVPPNGEPHDYDIPVWCDATKGGFHGATCDPVLVSAWWSAAGPYSGCGIGIAVPPEWCVVDIDDMSRLPELGRRYPALRRALDRCGTVAETPHGRHYIWSTPGVVVRQTHGVGQGGVRSLVDVKGGGAGYIQVPPADGRSWLEGGLDTVGVMPGPWLDALTQADLPLRRADGGGRVSLRPSTYAPNDDGESEVGPGERHALLLKLAGGWRNKGLSPDEIFVLLSAANAARCKPPKTDEEVRELADDVGTRYEAPEPPPPEPPPETTALEPVVVEGVAPSIRRGRSIVPTDDPGAVRDALRGMGITLAIDERGRLLFQDSADDSTAWRYLTKTYQNAVMGRFSRRYDMDVATQGGKTMRTQWDLPPRKEFRILAEIGGDNRIDLSDTEESVRGAVKVWAAGVAMPMSIKTVEAVRRATKMKPADSYRDGSVLGEAADGLWDAGWDQPRMPIPGRPYMWVSPSHPRHRGDERSRRSG